MGHRVSDGNAFNLTVPDGQAVANNELYRIGGINGFCVGAAVATGDTERTRAFEADPAAVYEFHVPSSVNPARGDFLYWSDASTFQKGSVDLVAVAPGLGALPAVWVTGTRVSDGAGGYVLRGRILNGVTGTGSLS